MGFLSPILFSLLSLIGVLILFYLFKKQYDKQTVSSIYLWEQTAKEWETNRWWQKLQRNLLLLLQILILLFLIIALTRPFYTTEGISGEHLVLVFDTSASMVVQENGGQTRFEAAKAKAVDLVDRLEDDQRVTIVNAEQSPNLLITKETAHAKVKQAIEELQISYQHSNLNESIALAEAMLAQHDGEIHLFSDSLERGDIKKIKQLDSLTVHNIGSKTNNLSLRAFGVKTEANGVSAIVTVKNESDSQQPVTVSIQDNKETIKQLTQTLAPKVTKTLTVKGLPESTVYEASIDNQDAYLTDNRRYAFLADSLPRKIYLAGEVSPFVTKGLQYSGAETVSVSKGKKGSWVFPDETGTTPVYVLSGVPSSKWPKGAKLIFSPEEGGPFDIQEQVDLQYRLSMADKDPLLQYVDVENIYLGKASPVGDKNGLKPLISSGQQTVVSKGVYDGSRTVLFSFDIQDSDWPLHPSFPILLQNALNYLSEDKETLGIYSPGEAVQIPLASLAEQAQIKTIEGKVIAEIDMEERTLKAPAKPGLYILDEATANGPRTRYFAVGLDSRELTAQAADPFTLTDHQKTETNDTTKTSKQGIWRWLAALGLIALIVEGEVYRRGVSR